MQRVTPSAERGTWREGDFHPVSEHCSGGACRSWSRPSAGPAWCVPHRADVIGRRGLGRGNPAGGSCRSGSLAVLRFLPFRVLPRRSHHVGRRSDRYRGSLSVRSRQSSPYRIETLSDTLPRRVRTGSPHHVRTRRGGYDALLNAPSRPLIDAWGDYFQSSYRRPARSWVFQKTPLRLPAQSWTCPHPCVYKVGIDSGATRHGGLRCY